MQSVKNEFQDEIEIKKSSFIAFLTPIDMFDAVHERLKRKHPKARHIVWAKRYLNEFDQIVENSSDDGEPKGTSGPPVLNVMRGADLIECAIMIVRYFGGIKLGTGGLVRAYGGVAKKVIEGAMLLSYEKRETLSFFTLYGLVSRFEHFFENEKIWSFKRAFLSDGVTWEASLSQSEKDCFLDFALQFERDGFRQI